MVLRETLALMAAGFALGLPLALAAMRVTIASLVGVNTRRHSLRNESAAGPYLALVSRVKSFCTQNEYDLGRTTRRSCDPPVVVKILASGLIASPGGSGLVVGVPRPWARPKVVRKVSTERLRGDHMPRELPASLVSTPDVIRSGTGNREGVHSWS